MAEDLFRTDFRVRRADLVAYAEASGDDNPIHQDEEAARAAGLPGVIAHGMYTMGLAANAITEWVGGVERVLDFSARFGKPVVVPEGNEGTTVSVSASVRKTNDDGTLELTVTASCDGVKVLSPCRATVLAER